MLRKLTKKILEVTYKPLILSYLKKERRFRYRKLHFVVYPGIFHPLFFNSSLILAKFITKKPLAGQKVLEIGSGSGFISVLMAQKGALVTAIDLDPLAVENTIANSKLNNLTINCFQSDLLQNVPVGDFRYIIINPPYYPQNPTKNQDLAWYCGQNFEYFRGLFVQLIPYYKSETEIFMILSQDVNVSYINSLAGEQQQQLSKVATVFKGLERNSIYQLSLLPS